MSKIYDSIRFDIKTNQPNVVLSVSVGYRKKGINYGNFERYESGYFVSAGFETVTGNENGFQVRTSNGMSRIGAEIQLTDRYSKKMHETFAKVALLGDMPQLEEVKRKLLEANPGIQLT